MQQNRFVTHSLKDSRILRTLSSALNAVDPAEAVRRYLPKIDGNVYGLGIGKASISMLKALAESVPLSGALAISKHASPSDFNLFPILLGGHPVPNLDSLRAGEAALEFVSTLHEDDTLVCLISGGGSALMTAPYVPLEDMQTLTSLLLACGARIDEINTLRRQLDRVKGGRLTRATKAKIISLILSDVIGNPLEAIASGPTVSDPTMREEALAILRKYGVKEQVPDSITKFLKSANFLPLIQKQASGFQNLIIGDNKLAAQAAMKQAQLEGFNTEILTNELQGEAREIGAMLAKQLRVETAKRKRPFCFIAGGETTVTIRGEGKGGRNQELALAAVNELRDLENILFVSLATDGEDGPTDAAGAVVTGESAQRAEKLGMNAADHLSKNDAYIFFDGLDDLVRTGPSGTNVNDLVFLFAL